MCIGAVQAAVDAACHSDEEDDASRVEQSVSFEDEQSFDADQNQGHTVRFREGNSVCSEPHSPSLMSVMGRSAVFSPQQGNRNSLGCDSPSLIVVESTPALWTDHKALPPKSPKREKPVLLGVPVPLSARGRERCVESEPLSARYRRRPAGCVKSSNIGGA